MRTAMVLAWIVLTALCRSAAADDLGLLDEWRWARFSTEDGLPDAAVNDVAETPDGRVFVGTERGVAWYDGWRFHAVPIDGAPPRAAVRSLAADDDGAVWLVCGQQLFRGDAGGFALAPLPDPEEQAARVFATRDALFVAVRHGTNGTRRLLRREGASFEPVPLPRGDEAHPEGARLESSGRRLWYLSVRGAAILSGDEWTDPLDGLAPHDSFVEGAQNEAGEFIIAARFPHDRAGIYEGGPGRAAEFRPAGRDGLLRRVAVGPQGEAVGVFDGGRVHVRSHGEWTALSETPHELLGATRLRFRANGDLWVCTPTGLALHREQLSRWSHWTLAEPSRWGDTRVNELAPARDGGLWIATLAGVTHRDADGHCERLPAIDGIERPNVTALAETPDGELWIGSGSTFNGLRRRTATGWESVRTTADGERIGLVHRLRCAADGTLYAMCLVAAGDSPFARSGGVFRVKDGVAVRFALDDPLRGQRAYAFAEGADGALWFGTDAGVSRLRDGVWRSWSRAPGDTEAFHCFDVLPADDGGAFVALQSRGLCRIDAEDELRDVPLPKGMSHDAAWGLARDGTGRLWVTTSAGLAMVDGDHYVLFDRSSGLDADSLWPLAVREGSVIVGSGGFGVWELDLDEMRDPAPRVVFAEPTAQPTFLAVRFAAHASWGRVPSYGVLCRHRVDGGEWSDWSTERFIEARGLDSGPHAVEVQTQSLFGTLGEPQSLTVDVPLPVHLRPIVIVPTAVLGVFLLLLGAYHLVRAQGDATALRVSELRWRRLFEEAADLQSITDAHGVVVDVNPRCAEVLGIPPEDVIGKPMLDVLGLPAATEDEVTEATVCLPGGSERHLESSFSRMRDGRGLWIVRDVTPRVRAERALLSRERTIRAVCEITTAHAVASDTGAAELLRTGCERLGFEAGVVTRVDENTATCMHVVGSDVFGARPGDVRPRASSLSGVAVAKGETVASNDASADPAYDGITTVRERGVRAFLATPTFVDGRPWGALLFVSSAPRPEGVSPADRDIAHLLATWFGTRTEQRIARENAARLEDRVHASQRLESLGLLAGGVAHDFNNLLASVLGNAGILRELLPAGSPGLHQVEQIETGAERAAELTQQLLAYAGRGTFALALTDISGLVGEMTRLLQVNVPRSARLQLDLAPGLPRIRADATHVRQVVMNLITNAVQALDGRAGAIKVTTGRLDLAAGEHMDLYDDRPLAPGGYVFTRVRDDGCGMDAATQARLFEPFFTTKEEGRGLGLSAVLGIVRRHAGGITVESGPREGTTITVLFPVAEGEAVRRVSQPGTPAPPAGRTLLVVDDEEAVRAVTSLILERAGYRVLTACDGIDALEVMAEHRDDVAAVLLDLMMPRMGGREALPALRAIVPDLPVLLMSAYVGAHEIDPLVALGRVEFLSKPYRGEELVRRLAVLLATR